MKIFEKIKQIREDKKLSQTYVAHELHLDQSQYSRREKGMIPFLPDELEILSKVLTTPISIFFGEENQDITINTKNGRNFEIEYISLQERLIEQFEARLKEKDEIINMLKKRG